MIPFFAWCARHLHATLDRLRTFRAASSGQVAMTFGLMLLPILFAAGASVDYGRRSAAKAQLDAALDGAVLAVISQKSNTVSQTNLTNMETFFRAEAAKVAGVTVTGFVPTPTVTGDTISLTATYTATVSTTLASMMGVPSLGLAGKSASARNVLKYMDFYLLLDNSPSMGLAATAADITAMQNVTGGCAFACHKLNSNGTENTNDFYNVAKRNNIKLRVHVLREAVTALVDRAKSQATLLQQFRMEMWTFSDIQTRLTSLTSYLDTIKSDSTKIDLAYSYQSESDNQTSYERALAKMNTTVPASGDGLTALAPVRFLFFVTDGVQDTPIDGSVSNLSAGYKINDNRFISPINPTNCQALKDKGVRIGIIHTQYLPLYNNDFYNAYVKPFENKSGTLLQSCASPDLYFPVSTDGDITAAMLKMFASALASVRLTN